MATYIGIDIGKKTLYVYIPQTQKSFELSNNTRGFNSLIKIIEKCYKDLSEIIFVFEPTGGYERHLKDFFINRKLFFSIVHPNKVRQFAKAKGMFAKTDKIDSKLLYEYANMFSLPIFHNYSSSSEDKLRALLKRRNQFIEAKNKEISRLDHAYDDEIKLSIEGSISYIDNQLTLIEDSIKFICDNDAEIKDKISRLTSIPGVGLVLAITLICDLPEIGKINFIKLTSLVGLAPFARDSGQYKGKRSIYAGRGNLRKVLYMATIASLRSNHKIKQFYDHLIKNHKPPKVAIVAAMRKLLAFIHAIIKNNDTWNCQFN